MDIKAKIAKFFPKWLKKLPYSDKIAHAILGTIMFLGTWFFMNLFIGSTPAILIAFVFIFALGYLIELRDKYFGKGMYELLDWVATFIVPFLILVIKIIFF